MRVSRSMRSHVQRRYRSVTPGTSVASNTKYRAQMLLKECRQVKVKKKNKKIDKNITPVQGTTTTQYTER